MYSTGRDTVLLSLLFFFTQSAADTRVDRGLAQAIQQARLGKKMTQKQLATVSAGEGEVQIS